MTTIDYTEVELEAREEVVAVLQHEIEKGEVAAKKFLEQATDDIEYAVGWSLEETLVLIKTKKLLDLYLKRIQDWTPDGEQSLEDLLKNNVRGAQSAFLDAPWRHQSTSIMSHVHGLCQAEAVRNAVVILSRGLGSVKIKKAKALAAARKLVREQATQEAWDANPEIHEYEEAAVYPLEHAPRLLLSLDHPEYPAEVLYDFGEVAAVEGYEMKTIKRTKKDGTYYYLILEEKGTREAKVLAKCKPSRQWRAAVEGLYNIGDRFRVTANLRQENQAVS